MIEKVPPALACSWRGTLLDFMLEMAGNEMLAMDPQATAAIDSDFVPANATNSCCTQLTAMPATRDNDIQTFSPDTGAA